MGRYLILAMSLVLLLIADDGAARSGESTTHLGHVVRSWHETPGRRGLLPTAYRDAQVALEHAGYAVARGNSITTVKEHVGHVLHALDPSRLQRGPGTGFGLVRGITGVRDHLQYAAQSRDASVNFRAATPRLNDQARWIAKRARVMVELCLDARDAKTLEDALTTAEEIRSLARQVIGSNGMKGLRSRVNRLAQKEMGNEKGGNAGDSGNDSDSSGRYGNDSYRTDR